MDCQKWLRLKLNYCIFFLVHLFARDVLVMKKLEIEKTEPTFIISVLKVECYLGGLDFINKPTCLLIKLING